MCAQCFAQGATLAVPGLVALKVWARRRPRPTADPTVEAPASEDAAASGTRPPAHA